MPLERLKRRLGAGMWVDVLEALNTRYLVSYDRARETFRRVMRALAPPVATSNKSLGITFGLS